MTVKASMRFFASAAALAFAAAEPGQAQAPAEPNTAAPAEEQPASTTAGLAPPAGPAEIVVTATRREEALQDVPIAVTALTADNLANARISGTADLMQQVPNLNITAAIGTPKIFIRGIGAVAQNPGQEPSVATYVDGVYQSSPFTASMEFASVQRIEVIKGPQGTLFGRNATGGLVNVVTRDPSNQPEGSLTLSYGNFDTIKGIGYITTGLAENVAIDLSALYQKQGDGFGRNNVTGRDKRGQEDLALRSKLLIQPSDRTRIRITGDYSTYKGSAGNDLALLPGSIGVGGFAKTSGFYDIDADTDPKNFTRNWQVAGHVTQEFDPFDVVSITSYSKSRNRQREDVDATPIPVLRADISVRTRTFTQELQILSKKDSALTWIVGAFYYDSHSEGSPTGVGIYGLAFPAPLGGQQGRAFIDTKSISVYGEATYEFLPRTNLTIGGRYTRDKKNLRGRIEFVDTAGNVVSTTGQVQDSKIFSEPTYRVILDHKFTDDIMAYASYSRGFKSGGYDTSFPTGVPFRPEIVDAYEVGLKTQLLDKRMTFNIAAFKYDYKDLQLPILVNVGGINQQVTVNAADSTVKGIDIDAQLRIIDHLTMQLGFGYLDAKYENFPNAPCTRRSAAGVTEEFLCDVGGNRSVFSPKFQLNIGGTYEVPTSFGELSISANYFRTAKFFFDVTDRLVQPAYGLLNGQVAWTSTDERFRVALFAENLLNKKYTTGQYAQAGLGDSYSAGRPRLYGVELRARF